MRNSLKLINYFRGGFASENSYTIIIATCASASLTNRMRVHTNDHEKATSHTKKVFGKRYYGCGSAIDVCSVARERA